MSSSCNNPVASNPVMPTNTNKTFQPSLYKTTLIVCIALVVLIGLFVTIIVYSKEWRPYLNVFTAVLAALGLFMVLILLMKVRTVEKSYAANGTDTSNSLLMCPDVYTQYGKSCQASSTVMTLDDVLAGYQNYGKVLQYASTDTTVDVTTARAQSHADFLNISCNNADWQTLPWTSLKALCPGQ